MQSCKWRSARVAAALGCLLATATAAVAIAGGDPGSTRPAGWITYHDRAGGLTVRYPRSCQRASTMLMPFLADPRELLSLGTYPLRANGPDVCAQVPVRAIEGLRPADALITIEERQASAATGQSTARHISDSTPGNR